jgi:hypothetical protein
LEVILMLACDYANVEQSGKLNMMGVFNDIKATTFPIRHPMMHLVVKLGVELGEVPQDRTVVVRLLDEDQKEMLTLRQPFHIPPSRGARMPEMNFIFQLRDLVFQRPGTYDFALYVDEEFKRVLPIYVKQIAPPPGAPPTPPPPAS